MAEVAVRSARRDDAEFLALAIQEGDRGHTGIGSWDVLLLGEARARGRSSVHVGTYTGNDPAVATYLQAGFEKFAECRSVGYEERFKAPGLVFLRRAL